MKKIFLFLFVYLLHLSALELDINVGSGLYYASADGKLIYKKEFWRNSSAEIRHETDTRAYIWADITTDIEHFPKIFLELSQHKTEGKSFIHIEAGTALNQILAAIENNLFLNINNTNYESRLVQNTYEGFAYYEYFEDMDLPTLGFGLGVKKFDFDYSAVIIDGLTFNDNGGGVAPMLFFKSRYELEKNRDGTLLSIEGDAKIYLFGDSDIYDYLLKMDFLMSYNERTELGFELGYRKVYYNIKGTDIVNVGGEMSSSGVYFGLVAHFR